MTPWSRTADGAHGHSGDSKRAACGGAVISLMPDFEHMFDDNGRVGPTVGFPVQPESPAARVQAGPRGRRGVAAAHTATVLIRIAAAAISAAAMASAHAP